jgi:hypothetical protein
VDEAAWQETLKRASSFPAGAEKAAEDAERDSTVAWTCATFPRLYLCLNDSDSPLRFALTKTVSGLCPWAGRMLLKEAMSTTSGKEPLEFRGRESQRRPLVPLGVLVLGCPSRESFESVGSPVVLQDRMGARREEYLVTNSLHSHLFEDGDRTRTQRTEKFTTDR